MEWLAKLFDKHVVMLALPARPEDPDRVKSIL